MCLLGRVRACAMAAPLPRSQARSQSNLLVVPRGAPERLRQLRQPCVLQIKNHSVAALVDLTCSSSVDALLDLLSMLRGNRSRNCSAGALCSFQVVALQQDRMC